MVDSQASAGFILLNLKGFCFASVLCIERLTQTCHSECAFAIWSILVSHGACSRQLSAPVSTTTRRAAARARSSPHPSALFRLCLRPAERTPARSVPSKPPPGAAGCSFDGTERARTRSDGRKQSRNSADRCGEDRASGRAPKPGHAPRPSLSRGGAAPGAATSHQQ